MWLTVAASGEWAKGRREMEGFTFVPLHTCLDILFHFLFYNKHVLFVQ